MATLASCIRKAGKALNAGDAATIREIYDDLRTEGGLAPEAAADQAIGEYLDTLTAERADITAQVRAQGGTMPGDQTVRFAPDSGIVKRTAKKLNMRRILSGQEKLDITPTTESGIPIMRDVALALQERAKAINPDLEEQTDEAKDIIATTMADEVEAAMAETGHAGHWYSDKLRNAVALVAEIHPDLKDPNSQAMFLAALAITSNGQPVSKNAEMAEAQYQEYKRTGKFPEIGSGKEKQAMVNGFRMLNELLDKKGLDATRKFLATEYTKRELMDLGYGNILSGEGTEFGTHGSGIFGPKIGAGFYQNLIGNFNPLTTDRWFMRTWGRMVGKLMQDPYSDANNNRRDRLRKALSTKKGQEKLAELGYNKLSMANDTTLADIATYLHMQYIQTNYENKVEWNQAARNLDKGLNETIGQPSGAGHRSWIREVVAEARSILASRGTEVDTATLQALVWFPEKALYTFHGVGDAKATPTDYEQEFARIAEERGVDSATIRGILRTETGRRPRGVSGPGEPEGFDALRQPIEPSKRKLELVQSGVAAIRRTGRSTYRSAVPKRAGSLLDGAVISVIFKPQAFAKNQWERVGLSAPTINQLDTAADGAIPSAQAFTRAITAAKEAHPDGAAVYVYPQEEYEGARLYLTEDGMAGFALKGGDIVSVFKHPDLKAPGVVQSLISLAVQEGGRKLDAFDTMLPHFYEMQGFKVVSRIRWDENEMPLGWDKERFADFNNGEPDVVFMAWDPGNYNQYTGEGVMAESYEGAVARQDAAVVEDMYPDLGPMRLRIEDDAEEQFVDKHPEHPHSQLFKMAVTMEDQANNAPSIVQIIKDKITNAGDTAIEANLALIHRNYLEDFMPDARMSAIREYNHDIREMEGRKGELVQKYQPTAQKMFWHKTRNRKEHARLGEAMHAATINGIDPSEEYKALKKRENMTEADKKADTLRRAEYKILKDYYDTQLTQDSRDLFVEVRDQYSDLRNNMETAIMQRIEDAVASDMAKRALRLEMRKMFESGRVQGPYFPLDRWGDQWGAAYNEEGEIYSYSKFDTKSERVAWREAMEEAGFTVKDGKKITSDMGQLQALDPELVARLQKLTSGLPESDSIADEIYQMYLRSLPEMSMRKHFIHRKGRIGFSENILRSYAGQTFHGATQIARMEQQPKLERDMVKLREQAQAAEAMRDEHSDWAVPILNEMDKRHGLAMNPPKSVVASKLTNLGFAWMLGVTPGAAILNLFQTPMFAMPTIAARKGNGAVKTTAYFLKGIAEYFSTRIGGYKSKLRDDELAAYVWAEKTNILTNTMSHDLADLIEKDDTAYGLRRNIMTVVSYLFHHTEQANRSVTFMVAYRLARDRGLSHSEAQYDAADLNDRSHYDYSTSNRPPIMQKEAAKIVLLFKNYGVHSTYQMARALKDGYFAQKDLPIEHRREARRKLTGILMMTGLLGGVSSLPFAWVVETILNAVWGDDDEPMDAGAEFRVYMIEQGFSSEQVEALLTGGWDAMTGTTMSSRISLSYLGLGRESMYPLEGKDAALHFFEEMIGPVGSILVTSPLQGLQDVSEGRYERAIERVIPKFMRDPMKAVRYATEGALTYAGEPILTPEQFTNKDLFVQSIGLAPSRLTQRYEQNRAFRNREQKLLDRYKQITNQYWMALELGDPAARKEALKAMHKWSLANPQLPINAEMLERSSRSRARMSQQVYGGIALDPRLDFQIRKDLTYLPVETGEPFPRPAGVK